MADISKTVAIIFQGEDKASAEVQKIEDSLKSIGGESNSAADPVKGLSDAVESLGGKAGGAQVATEALREKLRDLGRDAGIPAEALQQVDLTLGRFASGSVIAAGLALATFGVAAIDAGNEASSLRAKLENITGSDTDASKGLETIRSAARKLQEDLGKTGDLFAEFLRGLEGTKLAANTVEAAFVGITGAVRGVGGDMGDVSRALDAFADAAKDGDISVKDLEGKISKIPGGLREFANALGVSSEELTELAKNGDLGAEAIDLFAQRISGIEFKSLSPITDAFKDLWNVIKGVALDMGAEKGFNAAIWAAEKAIQGVTLTINGSQATFELLGKTIANVAYSLQNMDWDGFKERQSKALQDFSENVKLSRDRFLGLDGDLKKSDGVGAASGKYKELANSLENTKLYVPPLVQELVKLEDIQGKVTTKTDKQTESLSKQSSEADKSRQAAEKLNKELAKMAHEKDMTLIKASVDINLKQLEADTRKAEALINSISTSVQSTGGVLEKLFGQMGNMNLSGAEASRISSQIDKENANRQRAFDLQAELTKEQISSMRARTKALNNGQALIKIDGAGLQPHLEGFMWEILRKIQTRVNQDGLEMLVGSPVPAPNVTK